MTFKKKLLTAAIAIPLLVGSAIVADTFIEDDNFRIMKEGEIYRSAQMSGHGWEDTFRKKPFASMLNLRGANPSQPWYAPEIAFANEKGIPHYDLALSANKQPSMETMETMVSMMRSAPKPLLIHCKQGADRTGLASALYAYAVLGKSKEEAGKQLSLWYGHFPWLTSRTGAMDTAFNAYTQTHPQNIQ